jgi:hypothetical protein
MRNGCHLRRQVMQQAEPLGSQIGAQQGNAGDIAARSVQAHDNAGPHRVGATQKYNRNAGSRRLHGRNSAGTEAGRDYSRPSPDEIGGKGRQPIVLVFSPAIFDNYVLPLGESNFAQAFLECRYVRIVVLPGTEPP